MMSKRPNFIWAICAVVIVAIILMGGGVVYTNYRIEKNNKQIDANQLENNRQFCDLFDEILATARPSAFTERIKKIYDSPRYRCGERFSSGHPSRAD